MEREYVLGGILALIVVVVIGLIFFANYQVYFEDVKQIADEVFQWSVLDYQNAATEVATSVITGDIDLCKSEPNIKCYCLLSKVSLPKDSQVIITNTAEKANVIALNEQNEVLASIKWPEGSHVGIIERRGKELVCTVPEYTVAIVSDKNNQWSMVEKRENEPEKVYKFLETPQGYYTTEAVDAASDAVEVTKATSLLPGLYKYNANTICLVTEKLIQDDSINDGYHIGQPFKLTDLNPIAPTTNSWLKWLGEKLGIKDDGISSAIDFLVNTAPCSPKHALPFCPRPVAGLTKEKFKQLIEGVALSEQQSPSGIWAEIRDKKSIDWSTAAVSSEAIFDSANPNDLDPFFLFAIIAASSGFNSAIISPDKGRAGIMYLSEQQVKDLASMGHSLPASRECCYPEDPKKDPRYDNDWAIKGGAILIGKYKRDLSALRPPICSIEELAAAFIAGPDAVIGARGIPPKEGIINYVKLVCSIYQKIGGRPCRPIITAQGEYKGEFIVFIDPGHGFGDPGACSGSFCEREINMKQSRLLRDELKKYGGVVTYLLRGNGEEGILDNLKNLAQQLRRLGFSSETTILLEVRRDLAVSKGAHITVSMHNNCAGCGRMVLVPKNDVGTEYGCSNGRCEESAKLATYIMEKLKSAIGKDYPFVSHKGEDRYGMLRGNMPSIIMEHSGIDGSDLKDDATLNAMAKSEAEGIIEYAVEKGFLKRTDDGGTELVDLPLDNRNVLEKTLESPSFGGDEQEPGLQEELPTTEGAYVDIAIVLDDNGASSQDIALINKLINAGTPKLTFAIIPGKEKTSQTAEHLASKYSSFDIILHQPMQYEGQSDAACNNDPVRICNNYDGAKAKSILSKNVNDFKGFENFVGFNNHQESTITQNKALMAALAEVAKDKGLIFLDSYTIGSSIAYSVMKSAGVRAYKRSSDAFLDGTETKAYTLNALRALEGSAMKDGNAVGIGHITKPTTIDAIVEYLQGFEKEGDYFVKEKGGKKIRLVTLSELPE